jgi:hypothetical protein
VQLIGACAAITFEVKNNFTDFLFCVNTASSVATLDVLSSTVSRRRMKSRDKRNDQTRLTFRLKHLEQKLAS